MKWLLTYCDGSSGYKTSNLITQKDAEKYLVTSGNYDEEEAAEALDDQGGARTSAVLVDDNGVLYPVPDNTSTPAFDDESPEDEYDVHEDHRVEPS